MLFVISHIKNSYIYFPENTEEHHADPQRNSFHP